MKVCILMGSPRREGNTAQLLKPFTDTLEEKGVQCSLIWLYPMDIKPCVACRSCQDDWSGFGCSQKDDMQYIFDTVLECDLLVLATPVYSWYCTASMKAVLDRLVYGMNKYFGKKKGPSLWAGKKLALISTCGYPPEKGADLWEKGMIRYCRHSELIYEGMLAEHDPGYKKVFMDEGKEKRARQFALKLIDSRKLLDGK